MISKKILVVDLDGTLIKSDLLFESVNIYLTKYPLYFFNIFIWLIRGKAYLKSKLAEEINIDVAVLPYNANLLSWLHNEKRSGVFLVLSTASNKVLAEKVAQYLNIFDDVLASDCSLDLKSKSKADALVSRFGYAGFDYVGNDHQDLQIWSKARLAHIVAPSASLKSQVNFQGNLGEVFDSGQPSIFRSSLKAMRLHQWMKNLLVFVPLFTAHQYIEISRDALALMSFVLFSLTASSVYLLNDLVDLQDDRHHAVKRHRPFASGALSLLYGWVVWPILLFGTALFCSIFMSWIFSLSLGLYFVLTLAYSLFLKKLAVVDVLTLASLYTLRIIAGAAAIAVPLSFWLLLFSMFVFLSLALIKRYSELKMARDACKTGSLRGRGYEPDDMSLVSSLGASAGFISVLVLALYIQDGQSSHLYAHPQLIWLLCPVMLFWISRAWLIAHRGQMNDDPVVFALKDKVSWFTGFVMLAVMVLARVLL